MMKTRLPFGRHLARNAIAGRASGIALAAALLTPSAAFAQDAGKDDAASPKTDEIIVTAQFREQALQDVPIAITAVTSQELEQRSVRTVLDVANSVPNVEMTSGASGYGSQTNQAFIRGLGQADFLPAFEPRVGFYVDDVYYSTTFGSVFDVLDLERVEVLRGPQGTLFGRNSVGGALRLISKMPRGDDTGYLEVTGGSRHLYQVRGAYDLGITDDLALRVVGSAKGQDGQVKRLDYRCVNPQYGNNLVGGVGQGSGNCQVGTLGGGDSYSGRGILQWKPTDKLKLTLSADYTHERSESPAEVIIDAQSSLINPETGLAGGAIPIGGVDNNGLAKWLKGLGSSYYGFDVSTPEKLQAVITSLESPDGYSSYARYGNERTGFRNSPDGVMNAYGGALTLEAELSDNLHLTSISAYRKNVGDFGQSMMAIPVEEVRNKLNHRQFSQEVRLLGSAIGDVVEYTLGGYYLDTKTLNWARAQFEGFTNPSDFYSDDTATLKSWALFGAVDLHPVDRLTLSAGLRYSDEKKTYNFVRDYTPSGLSVLNFTQLAENHDTRFNPRFSINYELTDDVNVYASYATGFTASAFNARPFGKTGVFALKPEEVTSYEAGIKSNLFGNALRLNAAAYFTRFDALVSMVKDPTILSGACAIYCYQNVGNADIKGFEVEAVARPTANLTISGNVGYTDFKYKELLSTAQGLSLDSPQTRVPKWKLSGAMQYDIPLNEGQTLTPRVDASYRTEIGYSNNVLAVSSVQPGYALVNLRLTYANDDLGLSLAAAVTNLFDQYYLTSITDQRESFGFLSATVGRPREWSLTLRKAF